MSGPVIFGGTFDPIHTAHMILAEWAADFLGGGGVLFVPAARPPHKSDRTLSPAEDREAMVRLAVEGNRRFALSRVEFEREGSSFAIDTIRQIRESASGKRPVYMIGGDSLVDLPGWKDPDAILEEAEVVVVPRPGFDLDSISPGLRGRVRFLPAPLLEISATMIRERVRRGESIRYMVPDRVREYIEARGLYRGQRERSTDGAE